MGDGDDGTNVHIPGPGSVDGDSILTKVVDFIVSHPVPVAAVILAVVATAFYKKNKALSIALGAGIVAMVATRVYYNLH